MSNKVITGHAPGAFSGNVSAVFDLGFGAIDTRYGKLGVMICWDQWYPEAARLTALAGAEVLGTFLMQIFFAVIGASANVLVVMKVGPVLFLFAALILCHKEGFHVSGY